MSSKNFKKDLEIEKVILDYLGIWNLKFVRNICMMVFIRVTKIISLIVNSYFF